MLDKTALLEFKPTPSSDDVIDSVTVHIRHRQTLVFVNPAPLRIHGTLLHLIIGGVAINRPDRPLLHFCGIRRNFGIEKTVTPLIPKNQLPATVTIKIHENQIMVLLAANGLDGVATPRAVRPQVRERIFPPPDFAALAVAAENHVQITVSVNVFGGGPGFNPQRTGLNDMAFPAVAVPNESHQCGSDTAVGKKDLRDTVTINVGCQGRCLLVPAVGNRQIPGGRAQVKPG